MHFPVVSQFLDNINDGQLMTLTLTLYPPDNSSAVSMVFCNLFMHMELVILDIAVSCEKIHW